jgi:VWFA-related protein
MRGAPFRAARSAAAEFISRLSDQDLLSIVFFSTRVGPSIAPTTDRAVASDVLESTRVGGETALFDAVENSVSRLSSTKADRRALVLLTDGRDNSSSATESKCESSAERDHVTVYCIGLGQGANADALRRLAEKTGGSFFATASPDDLAGIYRKIAGQIRNRYTLTYRSPASDRKQAWHTVGVQVRWKGLEAASVGQYLRMTQADSSGSDSGWPEGLLYPVVAGFVAVDMTLAGILLWRRRRARRR